MSKKPASKNIAAINSPNSGNECTSASQRTKCSIRLTTPNTNVSPFHALEDYKPICTMHNLKHCMRLVQ